jgi:16S rRNA (cytidine1402-2'-O)-methyltransferase
MQSQRAGVDRFLDDWSPRHALAPGLHVVATPIGNLADITLRALWVLRGADRILCEDTRVTAHLLAHYGIEKPLDPYHDHNADRVRPAVLAALRGGATLALVSDAGMPLVSDPGYKLVREAIAAGQRVISLPGPSSLLAALTCTGMATDTVLFAGFLPARAPARRARLEQLREIAATLVFFETPSRLSASLGDMALVFGAREAAVARELTKVHEEVRRGTPRELLAWVAAAAPRGEMVILVGPPPAPEVTDAAIAARLAPLLAHMRLSEAARTVAEELGVSRTRAYELALALRQERA